MNWGELLMLLCWVEMNRISALNYKFWVWDCWEKIGFWSKTHFKCFWEIGDFERIGLSCFEIGKHYLIVKYDRFKWLGRVGENRIKNRLKIGILCAKWRKTKKNRKLVLLERHDRACHRHGPCVQHARSIFCIFKDPNASLWVPNT